MIRADKQRHAIFIIILLCVDRVVVLESAPRFEGAAAAEADAFRNRTTDESAVARWQTERGSASARRRERQSNERFTSRNQSSFEIRLDRVRETSGEPRRLAFAQFTGYTLIKPPGSNVLGYTKQIPDLLDVRAGVKYSELQVHASAGLGTTNSLVRIRLMLDTASLDQHCTQTAYWAPHVTWAHGPPTPIDPETQTPARSPATVSQNAWTDVRFPYGGVFTCCYFTGANWYHLPTKITVKGAIPNNLKFWCISSTDSECRLQISGKDIKPMWTVVAIDWTATCGTPPTAQFFEKTFSTAMMTGTGTETAIHMLGNKRSNVMMTYKICYCPGYKGGAAADYCKEAEDFQQVVGLLYTTRVSSPQDIYPKLRFDLIVNCGAATQGGCPATNDLRIKIVDQTTDNSRPKFDTSSGCRSAPQTLKYFAPPNCLSSALCTLPPSVPHASTPRWNNLLLDQTNTNHVIIPQTYDVCFCYEQCTISSNWFKAGDIQTKIIQVTPDPIIMNTVVDITLIGANGGWTTLAAENAQELKILSDPEGLVDEKSCFQTLHDSSLVVGHVCSTATNCQAPSHTDTTGHKWQNIRITYPGMYAICYCDENCQDQKYWSFLKYHLVSGPYSNHAWRFAKGIKANLEVTGLDLNTQNRLRVIAKNQICGQNPSPPSSSASIPNAAPLQQGGSGANSVSSLEYIYDGTLLTFGSPHGLQLSDYVKLIGVTAPTCAYCTNLISSRPHKITRVESPTAVVIPIYYQQASYPSFAVVGASWLKSNTVTFQGFQGTVADSYKICWGANQPANEIDFVGTVGTVDVFEPPVFKSKIHLTTIQQNVLAPIIIAFETRQDPNYLVVEGKTQFKIQFRDLDKLEPHDFFPGASSISVSDAKQSICGSIFSELWSSDPIGYPMPYGCFYDETQAGMQEFSFVFGARNGLKGGTRYQVVLQAKAKAALIASSQPEDGVVHLWSMDDVDVAPFGVIEHGPTLVHIGPTVKASGIRPQWHASDGFKVVSDDTVAELLYDADWNLDFELRAQAGADIVEGTILRIFLWPLTQWNLEAACAVTIIPGMKTVSGEQVPASVGVPMCVPEAVVAEPGPGSRRNVLKLTMAKMDPITDTLRHTIKISGIALPTGGFFPTVMPAELQAEEGKYPHYVLSTGPHIFAKPGAVGSVVVNPGDGNEKPFSGDQGNVLYLKVILGASLWTPVDEGASLEIGLPSGYACVAIENAGTDVGLLKDLRPQGRGDLGLDEALDGFWTPVGGVCKYTLRRNGIIYAGSQLFIKVTVNNPIYALPRDSANNIWTIQQESKGAPFLLTAPFVKLSRVSAFSDTGSHLRSNIPVLGFLTDVTLSPTIFAAGSSSNELIVFFKTEQPSPGTGPQIQLDVPGGYGFLPQCVAQPLQSYYYALLSNRLTGITAQTSSLNIVRCDAVKRNADSPLRNRAIITVSHSAQLETKTTYGFKIQVHNVGSFAASQRDSFSLRTLTSLGDHLDGSYRTLRLLSSDAEEPGTSFGVYRLGMSSGSFVVGIDNMLPWSQTGLPSVIVVSPLRVPFNSHVKVEWRVVAPAGYIWDYQPEQFRYRTTEILGAEADLPVDRPPEPPALPPQNILRITNNFAGHWDRSKTYGFIARIRVPDQTPRSTANLFFIEFGYDSNSAADRLAAATCEAPRVRALVNAAVDYTVTNLIGQNNRLLFRVETITSIMPDGGLTIEAPVGFLFEEKCVLLDNPMRMAPYVDLTKAAKILCESETPYSTNRAVVSLKSVQGEIVTGMYEFMIDCRNPTTKIAKGGVSWVFAAYANIGTSTVSDIQAIIPTFPVESPMLEGVLVGYPAISYERTVRDDHPEQRGFVVLAFKLKNQPKHADTLELVVKAPLGFIFSPLCEVIVGSDVFGVRYPYPEGFKPFEAGVIVRSCKGHGSTALVRITPGLVNQRKYAFRLEVAQNPSVTPEYNKWTISFAGEATVPFQGFRLWAFTEVSVAATHSGRSTLKHETENRIMIHFRPTNSLNQNGHLLLTAPFGFRIPTLCTVVVERLNTLGELVATLPGVQCLGAPSPTNSAEIRFTDTASPLAALEKHRMEVHVINPLTIPIDPGSFRLQSYKGQDAIYQSLLDIGEAPSFFLTETFDQLLVTYPTYVAPTEGELPLIIQVRLPNNVRIGDALEILAPKGYDFAEQAETAQMEAEFRSCRDFQGFEPKELPIPVCRGRLMRFAFIKNSIMLDEISKMTPDLRFAVKTIYPKITLSERENTIYGAHKRGNTLISSKTVMGTHVTPRLQDVLIVRNDVFIAIESTSVLRIRFVPSQDADAITIETKGTGTGDISGQRYGLQGIQVHTDTPGQPLPVPLLPWNNDHGSVALDFAPKTGQECALILKNVTNPREPGRALWTVTTYAKPALGGSAESWLVPAQRRDQSKDLVGPIVVGRIELSIERTRLAEPYFDAEGVELLIDFHVRPSVVAGGQYLTLYAPFGYQFVDNTFVPLDGFPQVSGSVYVRLDGDDEYNGRAYVIQTRFRLLPYQDVRFSVRLNTPPSPVDLATWEADNPTNWFATFSSDPEGTQPTFSNDRIFPGFKLQSSFGKISILPEPNGVTPSKNVMVEVHLNPISQLLSLNDDDGSVHVRVTAPIGFSFDDGCLAITPNDYFEQCVGDGRIAILPCRGRTLNAGLSVVHLRLTNAGIMPVNNRWIFESFLDMPMSQVRTAVGGSIQRSTQEGYAIKELIQASVGANTQIGMVVTVYIWFLATHFLDVGGSVELHAPIGYELRCTPQVEYITLPAGTCKLLEGENLGQGGGYHHYLSLTFTHPNEVVYPNTAYEFGVSAVHPLATPESNYWGLVFRNSRKEIVDANLSIHGMKLTNLNVFTESLIPSTSQPSVVNLVQLTVTLMKDIPAKTVGHITIVAPTSTKVLCQQFQDLSEGGSSVAKLPLIADYGSHGDHSCQFPNTMTLHVDSMVPIKARTYTLQLGVLNPSFRAVKDYWAFELLEPDLGVLTTTGTTSTAPTTTITTTSTTTTVTTTMQLMNATTTENVDPNATMAPTTSAMPTSAPALVEIVTTTTETTTEVANETVILRDWKSAAALMSVRMRGFGISSPFDGRTIPPVDQAIDAGFRSHGLLWLLSAVVAFVSEHHD